MQSTIKASFAKQHTGSLVRSLLQLCSIPVLKTICCAFLLLSVLIKACMEAQNKPLLQLRWNLKVGSCELCSMVLLPLISKEPGKGGPWEILLKKVSFHSHTKTKIQKKKVLLFVENWAPTGYCRLQSIESSTFLFVCLF